MTTFDAPASPGVLGAPGHYHLERGDATAFPLSPHQEAVWLLQELWPESRAYTAHQAVALSGDLEVGRLRAALQALVDRHEALSAVIRLDDAGIVQETGRRPTATFELGDVSAAELDDAMARIVRQDFDLADGPLARWTLLRLAPTEHVLVQSEHHIVHDGWSSRLLLRELATAYRRGPGALGSPAYQYGDFVRWQQRWLASADAQRQQQRWCAALADVPSGPLLPRRDAAVSQAGGALRWPLPADLAAGLRAIASELRVTPFAVALAAFADVLGDTVDPPVIPIVSGFANRRAEGAESVVGMCVNTVVLPVNVAARRASWRGLVDHVFDVVLFALDTQELPFPHLVAALDPPRSADHSPYAQVAFSMHDAPTPPLDLGDVRAVVTEGVHPGSAKFALNVILITTAAPLGMPAGLTASWEWTAGCLTGAEVADLADAWQGRLREWAGGCD